MSLDPAGHTCQTCHCNPCKCTTEPNPQTPLTDALIRNKSDNGYDHWTNENALYFLDFARSLELKLQEAEAKLSWWKEFEHRIGHALDGVGMSTDEPADINIVNMGKRIVELKEKLQEAEARVVELDSAESQPDLNEPPQPGFTHKVAAESRLNYIRILLVKLQQAKELHIMQLAAISTSSICNTEARWKEVQDCHKDYQTCAFHDVVRAVRREIDKQAERDQLIKVVDTNQLTMMRILESSNTITDACELIKLMVKEHSLLPHVQAKKGNKQ